MRAFLSLVQGKSKDLREAQNKAAQNGREFELGALSTWIWNGAGELRFEAMDRTAAVLAPRVEPSEKRAGSTG